MRKLMLLVWLLLPVLVGFYHAGPGQQRLLLDRVDHALRQADGYAAAGDWTAAEKRYDDALNWLPSDRVEQAQRIRLERSKVQMQNKQLPVAHQDLKTLVDELKADATTNPQLLWDARSALANSQYYMTWLLRLEGQPRERWEPEIESARQAFCLLAEQADATGDAAAASTNRENLESAVRLARMELSDLQGLPLPSQ